MTDSDTEMELKELHKVVSNLNGPLFGSHKGSAKTQDLPRSSDVIQTDVTAEHLYAVTVNLKPNYITNRRPWKKYTADKQRGILTRMEQSLRKKTPSIQLLKLTFEECPILGQQHFHALYSMPELFKAEMETYWEKYAGNLPDTRIPWRPVVIKEVFNEAGWLEYITKDQKTI